MRGVPTGLLAAVIMAGSWAVDAARAQTPVAGFETVELTVPGPRAGAIAAYLLRPESADPVPAIVALHGCGGLLTPKGKLPAREHDWARRFVAAGFAVLLPDSFNPRGYRQICTFAGPDRPIRPGQRAYDAAAAATWLEQQPFVDKSKIALIGWSNGGAKDIFAIPGSSKSGASAHFRIAFAFYPGCLPAVRRADYAPRVPTTILIGSDDDWTPAAPCRELAQKHKMRLIEYSGAVHGFDAPNSPRHTRAGVGLSARGDGKVEIGTDPQARAAAITEVMSALAHAFGGPTPAR